MVSSKESRKTECPFAYAYGRFLKKGESEMTFYRQGRAEMDAGEYEKAKRLFAEGINAGEIKCLYGNVAVHAVNGQLTEDLIREFADKISEFITLTEKDDDEACFIVGRCYEMGCGVEQNKDTAIKYYVKAANLKNTDAMFNLGCMMMESPEFTDVAFSKYILPAAEKNNKDAQFAAGYYYEQQKNYVSAEFWYRAAAYGGNIQMKTKHDEFLKQYAKEL